MPPSPQLTPIRICLHCLYFEIPQVGRDLSGIFKRWSKFSVSLPKWVCTPNDNSLTADPFLEFLWLDPILDPDLELDILLSFSSLARSAFFSSNAYSPASFKPRSLEILTRNFRHSTFSGNFRCTNWNDLSWKQVILLNHGLPGPCRSQNHR